MTAFISATTAGYGVQVYQDHNDKQQFYYVPLKAEAVLGSTLQDFKVDYWGIGPAYYVGSGSNVRSVFGAILSGTASIDISSHQRKKITEQVEREFTIKNPRLAPLRLRSVKINPVFADKTLEIGANGDKVWPKDMQFGSNFNYLVGTGNSLFANYVAAQGEGVDPIVNPGFAVNVDAKAEFRGEPWKAEIICELSSFWREIRTHIKGSARFGWFKIGSAEYNRIIKELERKKIITINFESGSLDLEKYGSQIFEMGKAVAEAINAGQGGDFFKFQPNPDQAVTALGNPGKKRILSLSPWSVSINASYSEQSFTQKITFKETISYVGNFEASVPSSMPLALICNYGTKQYFNDLASSEPCVTPDKVTILMKRLAAALDWRNKKLDEIYDALLNGKISPEVYNILKSDIESRTPEELTVHTPTTLNIGKTAKELSNYEFHKSNAWD